MTALRAEPRVAASPPARRLPSLLDAIWWEVRKLRAQARAKYTLLVVLLAPILIVVVIQGQQRPPKDTLFGRYAHNSGFSVALLVLGFAAQWVLPLLTTIVAGDIFASEDQLGTWKTVLTRSVSRRQLFWAKTLTAAGFTTLLLLILGTVTIVSSALVVGRQPLLGLSGQTIPSGTAGWLTTASWASALAPMLAITSLAILLSVRSRNPAVGIAAPVVLAMVMQLVGALGGLEGIRPLLITTPFEAWHGLLVQDRFTRPLVEGIAVSAGWCLVCLGFAYASLRRRDITGG
jgi:ABC-2 type transport system permease protein